MVGWLVDILVSELLAVWMVELLASLFGWLSRVKFGSNDVCGGWCWCWLSGGGVWFGGGWLGDSVCWLVG